MKKARVSAKLVSVTAVLAMMSISSMAHADEREILPGMVIVPEPTLAKMRGKYVASSSQVVYFGVQMQSNWDAPNGALLNAGASVSVNLTTPTPTVSFTPTASIEVNDTGNELTDTTGRTVTSSGLDNVSGVTQSVQSAGDFNSTTNLTRINFLSEIPDDSSGVIGSNLIESSDGMSASSTLDDNSVVVQLEMADQGVAVQSIKGAIDGASGKGAYQTIVVLGDRHSISNQLEMNVVLGNESEQFIRQQGLGTAIGNLRGLTPGM